MKKTLKCVATIGLVMSLSASFTLLSFAGWEQTGPTWKYKDDSQGIYLTGWNWLDGNKDDVAECYYLDSTGVMVANTSIDGWTVNDQGQWILDGVIQTKVLEVETQASQPQQTASNDDSWMDQLTPEERAYIDSLSRTPQKVNTSNGGHAGNGVGGDWSDFEFNGGR